MDPFFEIDAIVLSEFAKTEDFKTRMNRYQSFLLQEIEQTREVPR